MREALIILAVIAVLFALSAFRYRKQIKAAYGVWKTLKEIRSGNFPQSPSNLGKERDASKLARCMKCGSWHPESGMIRVGSGPMFCSAKCLEKGAKQAV
jgi:hypothetical protein